MQVPVPVEDLAELHEVPLLLRAVELVVLRQLVEQILQQPPLLVVDVELELEVLVAALLLQLFELRELLRLDVDLQLLLREPGLELLDLQLLRVHEGQVLLVQGLLGVRLLLVVLHVVLQAVQLLGHLRVGRRAVLVERLYLLLLLLHRRHDSHRFAERCF